MVVYKISIYLGQIFTNEVVRIQALEFLTWEKHFVLVEFWTLLRIGEKEVKCTPFQGYMVKVNRRNKGRKGAPHWRALTD